MALNNMRKKLANNKTNALKLNGSSVLQVSRAPLELHSAQPLLAKPYTLIITDTAEVDLASTTAFLILNFPTRLLRRAGWGPQLRRASNKWNRINHQRAMSSSEEAGSINDKNLPDDLKGLKVNSRLSRFMAPTVWHEFTPLANQHNAINLGQGFPDWDAPPFCKEAAKAAIDANFNQYCRSAGLPSLVHTIAKIYSPRVKHEIDPLENIAVSVGVSEGLFATMQAWLNPGDEVILIEPAFDIYAPQIGMAGGVVKYIPLRPPASLDEGNGQKLSSQDWTLDIEELKRVITPKTKILLLNNPHNPVGKVFTKTELKAIAEVVLSHENLIVISDEVYERIVFEEFYHMAELEGMWDRTITMFSAGKTFSVTGWKIGWLVGPKHLIFPVQMANAWIPFSVATPLQEAVARALVKAEEPYEGHANYYEWLKASYKRKRDLLLSALENAGLSPLQPAGSFFTFADTSNVEIPKKYTEDGAVPRDYAFCRWLTVEKGVAAIPPSAFFSAENKYLATNYARFAFCKKDETIVEAGNRLENLVKR